MPLIVKTALVTAKEFEKAREYFSDTARHPKLSCLKAPSEEALLAAEVSSARASHVIVGTSPYRGSLYEALRRGAVIARFGTGLDNIDLKLATEKGIIVTKTRGATELETARFTISLMLAQALGLSDLSREVKAGSWPEKIMPSLAGKQLAIIGCGTIGNQVARIANKAFGMEVVGFYRGGKNVSTFKEEYGYGRLTPNFEDAIAKADYVSIHLPSNAETREFINAERLKHFKPGAILVNTARGAIVDERALYGSLKSGHLSAALLDVFQKEPYEPASADADLRTLPQVFITPHCASASQTCCLAMAQQAVGSITRVEDGMRPEHIANPEVLDR